MEKAAGKLADVLVRKNVVEKEDRDFYRYAIETVLVYAINLITMFILAAVTKKLPELLMFLVVFYPIRTNCGGKHMNTWYGCYILSCILIEAVLLISGVLHIHMAVLAVIIVCCLGCIWLLAPVEHHDHPMEEQDFVRGRKKVRIFSICVAVAAFVFKYFGLEVQTVLCLCSEVMCSVVLLWGVLEEKIRGIKEKVEV